MTVNLAFKANLQVAIFEKISPSKIAFSMNKIWKLAYISQGNTSIYKRALHQRTINILLHSTLCFNSQWVIPYNELPNYQECFLVK